MQGASGKHPLLDLYAGHGGHRVRPRDARDQIGLAFDGVAVDPGLQTLPGQAHCGGDMSLFSAGLVPLDDQLATVNAGRSIELGSTVIVVSPSVVLSQVF